MARIKPEDRTPKTSVSIQLREDIARQLHAYAQYLEGSSVHYVVGALLEQEFQADKEFKQWCAAHPEALDSLTTTPESGTRRSKKATLPSPPNGTRTVEGTGKKQAAAVGMERH